MRNLESLDGCLKGAASVAIAGHVRPDGDCVGSCMAVYNYILDNYPQTEAVVYLEEIPQTLEFLAGTKDIRHLPKKVGESRPPLMGGGKPSAPSEEKCYDLFVVLDCGDRERLGESAKFFDSARRTVCIDHHISNSGFGMEYVIEPEAAATCEILYGLMDPEKISLRTAEALYTGIIHDSGVFQYSNTTRATMEIGAALIEKGVPFTKIIEESFYQKTYLQNQILGRALMESILVCDKKVIVSVVRKKDMIFYGVAPQDLDGIVSQLRSTKGVEVAIFLYETAIQEYKVSMRSNGAVDVSRIAVYYNGGGHVKAAGCTMQGSVYDVINNLTGHIVKQLKQERAQ